MGEERRDNESREQLLEMVQDIRRDTGEIRVFLLGINGQAGFVAQTNGRLDNLDNPRDGRVAKLETRILLWAGALSILIPCAAWAVNHYLK